MYDAVEPIYTAISDIASCETSLNPNAVAANPIRRRLGARRESYGRIHEYGYVNVRTYGRGREQPNKNVPYRATAKSGIFRHDATRNSRTKNMKDCEYLIDILPTEQCSTPQTAFENDRCAGRKCRVNGRKILRENPTVPASGRGSPPSTRLLANSQSRALFVIRRAENGAAPSANVPDDGSQ
ncbi:hypothetical protein V9T40_010524 [Parthenolecanium corni]|uniref:Uncharacterized protein n=1 Tax=Parthenolecanium corni TaxID=536013 RepID=A0AAN9T7K1_9HEMI